MNKMIKIKI